MTQQIPHFRMSTRGRRFPAGRGKDRRDYRMDDGGSGYWAKQDQEEEETRDRLIHDILEETNQRYSEKYLGRLSNAQLYDILMKHRTS